MTSLFYVRLCLIALLSVPTSGWSHGDHTGRGGTDFSASTGRGVTEVPSFGNDDSADDSNLPSVIQGFDIVRFTRFEHRALHRRIRNNVGQDYIVGLSDEIALKATAAGQIAPRAVGKLFFEMWKSKTLKDRNEVLSRTVETLTQEHAQLFASQDPNTGSRATKRKLQTTRLMLDLAITWQSDPMDGLQ